MSDLPTLDLRQETNTIRIMNAEGDQVWIGTVDAFGMMLAAMRSEVIKEWRCWREDRSYGPPCTPETRDTHTYKHRHVNCTWIVYYEVQP